MEIGNKNIKLEHLEEAYTTEHWLVRVYRVLKPGNRPKIPYTDRQIKAKNIFSSKKVKTNWKLTMNEMNYMFDQFRQVKGKREPLRVGQLL